ncbi:MAG: glycosyltransferase, partial [Natronospirillum sp.]
SLLSGILMARSRSANNPLTRLLLIRRLWRRLLSRFTTRVRACKPDIMIATQMMPAAIMARAKMEGRISVPTIGVVTDFGVHDFWIQEGIDYYCLGHHSFADLRSVGINPDRVHATGIPLMPVFSALPDQRTARHELGLDLHTPVVMIAGGGLGLGVAEVAETLLKNAKCQLLVVVGQNELAATQATALAQHHPGRIRVFRWTENMARLVCAADVVVSKPGGLTVAETLTCGRPLLATQSLKGQEGFNVRFLETHGAGLLLDGHQLPQAVCRLLDNPRLLSRMQAKAARIGCRSGTHAIIDLVETLVARPTNTWAIGAKG